MQSMGVVEANDALGNIADCLTWIGVAALPDALHLQAQEEPLHGHIVPTIAFPAHAGDQAVARQQVTMGLAGILASPIGMHA